MFEVIEHLPNKVLSSNSSTFLPPAKKKKKKKNLINM
jgi:hypothetical protein